MFFHNRLYHPRFLYRLRGVLADVGGIVSAFCRAMRRADRPGAREDDTAPGVIYRLRWWRSAWGSAARRPMGHSNCLELASRWSGCSAALFGSASSRSASARVSKSARDEQEPWRRVLHGGIVLGLSFLLPHAGLSCVMPFIFICGFGAFVICARRDARDPRHRLWR